MNLTQKLKNNSKKSKISSLFKASIFVSLATFISRILGLVRDVLFANYFGVNAFTETFLIAFKIPNFWRRLFAEGAFTQAFVPVLAKYNQSKNPQEIQKVINTILTYFILILIVLTVLVLIFPQALIYLFASGLSEQNFGLAKTLLRLTFPYLLFLSLCAFFNAILNYYKIYFLPALTPIWLNLTFILGIILFYGYFEVPIILLGYLVFVAGLIQLGFVLSIFFLNGYRFNFSLKKHSSLKRLIDLIIPNLFTISATQISLLINLSIASYLVVGSITWLYYAERLLELPAGLLTVAIASIVLPRMAVSFSNNQIKKLSSILNWSIIYICLLGIPASFALFYLAPAIVSTLFYYGKFSLNDLDNTALAVQAYMIGLPFLLLIKVLTNTFFAMHDSKTPMKIAICSIILNIIGSLILAYYFSHIGLAIATSVTNILHSGLLIYVLNKRAILLLTKKFLYKLLKIIVSASVMCFFLSFIIMDLSSLITLQRILYLSLYCFTGGIVYFMCLLLFRFDVLRLIKRNF